MSDDTDSLRPIVDRMGLLVTDELQRAGLLPDGAALADHEEQLRAELWDLPGGVAGLQADKARVAGLTLFDLRQAALHFCDLRRAHQAGDVRRMFELQAIILIKLMAAESRDLDTEILASLRRRAKSGRPPHPRQRELTRKMESRWREKPGLEASTIAGEILDEHPEITDLSVDTARKWPAKPDPMMTDEERELLRLIQASPAEQSRTQVRLVQKGNALIARVLDVKRHPPDATG